MKITCIKCPLSCSIDIKKEEGGLKIEGYECEVGRRYAIEEMEKPMRILTTTVAVKKGIHPVLPVRTEKEIPKNLLFDAIEILSNIIVEAPIQYGDIVYRNICGTGVNVIASRDIKRI
ncbi:MAG: molybdopterin oxidoreductase [Thermoplasmata archaeon]|nr:MAG: molybdopterin oxidoreductase [Thermoplasmata archaeon]HEC89898.1 DUF1667 domain-containing protein [Thermoplasmatales archaeon]